MSTVQFNNGVVLFGDPAAANTDKVAMHSDCCCAVTGCTGCDNEEASGTFRVVIAGVADDGCGGTECADEFNDTFDLVISLGGGGGCSGVFNFGKEVCGYVDCKLSIIVFDSGGGNSTLRVLVFGESSGAPVPALEWEKVVAGTFDCLNFSSFSLPYIGSGNCDGSSSTCLVTSL